MSIKELSYQRLWDSKSPSAGQLGDELEQGARFKVQDKAEHSKDKIWQRNGLRASIRVRHGRRHVLGYCTGMGWHVYGVGRED